MADALRKRIWAGRLSWWALALSLGGVVAALIGAIGSGQGLWPFMTGFLILRWAFYAAVAGGVLAIVAWFMARRAPGSLGIVNLVALIVAIAFAAYLLVQVRTARSVPPIHDVTTDTEGRLQPGHEGGGHRQEVDLECQPGTGATVAQEPGPRPRTVTRLPGPRCPL